MQIFLRFLEKGFKHHYSAISGIIKMYRKINSESDFKENFVENSVSRNEIIVLYETYKIRKLKFLKTLASNYKYSPN
jgi:hypothetical protein